MLKIRNVSIYMHTYSYIHTHIIHISTQTYINTWIHTHAHIYA